MKSFGFMELRNFSKYLADHQDAELGFTDDTPGVEEATGWFGIKISKEFDGRSIIIGYYGAGIVYCSFYEIDEIDEIDEGKIVEAIKHFFRSELELKLKDNTKICVCKEDFKDLNDDDFD